MFVVITYQTPAILERYREGRLREPALAVCGDARVTLRLGRYGSRQDLGLQETHTVIFIGRVLEDIPVSHSRAL